MRILPLDESLLLQLEAQGFRRAFITRAQAPKLPADVPTLDFSESNSEYIRACTEAGYQPHPARFPRALPEFFVKLLTDEQDVVVDPFGGSNMTGAVAEELLRRWLCFEIRSDYLKPSRLRFSSNIDVISVDDPKR